MRDLTFDQPGQGTTRRAFLKQVFALTGASAGAALLSACGAASTTAASGAAPTAGASATSTTSQSAAPAIVAAANAFVATLSDAEKSTGLFAWTDTAQRQRWSNFPPAGFKRAGLMWGDLSAAQQTA